MSKLNHAGISGVVVLVIIFSAVILVFTCWKVWKSKTDNKHDMVQSTGDPERITMESIAAEKVATGQVITTGDSEFGAMLFDDRGQAIYIWELEESSNAECYADCAEAWPPVLTDGTPRAAGGVRSELLGTTKRTDGSTQVTYNGHPLYYYAHEGPGEVECHNIRTHGGLWWVIQPSGIRAE